MTFYQYSDSQYMQNVKTDKTNPIQYNKQVTVAL